MEKIVNTVIWIFIFKRVVIIAISIARDVNIFNNDFIVSTVEFDFVTMVEIISLVFVFRWYS